MQEHQAMLDRIRQVLKLEGRLVIVEPIANNRRRHHVQTNSRITKFRAISSLKTCARPASRSWNVASNSSKTFWIATPNG
jgi:hypothetical protein